MHFHRVLFLRILIIGGLAGSAVFLSACSTPGGASGKSAAVLGAEPGWLRTELYFALRRVDRAGEPAVDLAPGARGPLSDADWQVFLDEVVTPKFPDGLSVFDAYGQWKRREDGRVFGLVSKVLVVLHPATPEAEAGVEAVRAEFLARTGQESVLRGSQPIEVSF